VHLILEKVKVHFLLGLSLVSYAASLLLPAVNAYEDNIGLELLQLGWLGAITLNFSWYANPSYLVALTYLLAKKNKSASKWALIAFFLSLSFLLYPKMVVGSSGSYETTVLLGYYFWVVSFACIYLYSILLNRLNTSKT
jgi:hypothetical protein